MAIALVAAPVVLAAALAGALHILERDRRRLRRDERLTSPSRRDTAALR